MSEQTGLAEPVDERPGAVTGRSLANVPWWVVILVLTAVVFIWVLLTNENYRETFNTMIFGRAEAGAAEGILLTARITLISFVVATVIGLLTGLARVSKNPFVYNLATLYVEVIRGVPLVVLMLYIAFVGVPLVINLIASIGELLRIGFLIDADIRSVSYEARAISALAFGYGAYEAEVFRAGIQSIERGQMEAARSLGMTYFQAMRYVILPQAIRRVLPPLGNDFIAMLKDSSLATVLAVPELTQLGRILRSSTFRVYEIFNIVAFLYLSMTIMLSLGVKALERRLGRDRPSTSTIR